MTQNNRLRLRSGLSIGALAERTGLAVSAIRFYESEGLVHPWRNAGGQRRFERSDIRRLSFVMIAQKFGFSIARIREVMQRLPDRRTPNAADWRQISEEFREELDSRIAALERMRDKLDGCIGCGCLSMKACALYNDEDKAHEKGNGPRYLLGDEVATRPPAQD
ncbi:Redox-sensitive transcriptional activator SoxR [Thalassovita autumnalis]|uniref:Redox-sensitive transcriptional activator SoxR n=1 Tax=Thalassovita autumnalis TaxID=2072972 RepID=A0A0P1FXU7_9RHOB|nr:redox-sensitive transcriptional activator SoxR [Thalassovita autumnalis]CUH67545.1 Redox-sensitive transcriptional activator SoxR [Thalassovita autumnalis]CUH73934.1 Redox-sensitive transcriptional activator SoxR [Thalassovita autumnalis]